MALFDFLHAAAELRFDGTTGLLDSDGDGVADPARVAVIAEEAGAILETLLASAWPDAETRAKMVQQDPMLRGLAADLFIALAGRSKSAFMTPDGLGPYAKLQERAEAKLAAAAAGALRTTTEPTTGVNPIFASSSTRRPEQSLVFVPTRRNPRAGGGF